MRKLLILILAVLAGPAFAADLPAAKKVSAPVYAGPTTPFYLIVGAGAGASSVQNALTLNGLQVLGTPKQYPTGFMAQTGVGIQALGTPIGAFELELLANYDFTAESLGCIEPIGCLGHAKNSWLFQPMVYYSPIAAPLSFTGWQWAQGVGIYGGVGWAVRKIEVVDMFGVGNSAWLNGFDVGAKVEIPITKSVNFRLTYDWVDYTQRITTLDSPIAATSFSAPKEQLFRAGLDFHF